MIPGISAGSNHVGASETCTPQVSCPSGPAPLAMPGAAISNAQASMAQSGAGRRGAPCDLYILVRKKADEHVGARPTFSVGMAFPLRMRRKRRSFATSIVGTKAGAHAQRTFLFLGEGLGRTPASMSPDYRTSIRAQGSGEPKFAPGGLARVALSSLLTGKPTTRTAVSS